MAHKHIRPEEWPAIARMLRAGYTGAEMHDWQRCQRSQPTHGRNGYDTREVQQHKRMVRETLATYA